MNAVLLNCMVLLYTFLCTDDGKKLVENKFGQIIFPAGVAFNDLAIQQLLPLKYSLNKAWTLVAREGGPIRKVDYMPS